jgi:hypothetical protein
MESTICQIHILAQHSAAESGHEVRTRSETGGRWGRMQEAGDWGRIQQWTAVAPGSLLKPAGANQRRARRHARPAVVRCGVRRILVEKNLLMRLVFGSRLRLSPPPPCIQQESCVENLCGRRTPRQQQCTTERLNVRPAEADLLTMVWDWRASHVTQKSCKSLNAQRRKSISRF